MLTLTSVLRRTLRLYCERPAILDSERNFTWAQFGERVVRAAGVLRSLGITRGARYEILCRNSFRNNELMHAGYWMGAVPVPVNYRLAPPEIAYVLQNSACKLLIVEDVFADLLDAEVLAPWAEKVLLVAAVKRDRPWLQYEDLLADAEPLPAHDSAEDEEAVLLYTGGTTGRPKGVRLSHRNVVANGFQVGFEFQARANDIYLHAAPMFHSADLLATAYAMAGASHVFLPRFSGRALLEAIQSHGVTSTMLTPTMIAMAMQEPDFETYDLSSLRQLIYGGLASQKWRAPTETGGVLWDEESDLQRSSSARRFAWC